MALATSLRLLVALLVILLAPAGMAMAQTNVTTMSLEDGPAGVVDADSGRVWLDPREEPFTISMIGSRVFLSLPAPISCEATGMVSPAFALDSHHVELTVPQALALSVVLARRPIALYLRRSGSAEHLHSCVAHVVQLLAL